MKTRTILLCQLVGVFSYIWITTTSNMFNLIIFSFSDLFGINERIPILVSDYLFSIFIAYVFYFLISRKKLDLLFKICNLLGLIIFTIMLSFDDFLTRLFESSFFNSLQHIYMNILGILPLKNELKELICYIFCQLLVVVFYYLIKRFLTCYLLKYPNIVNKNNRK